MPHRILVVRNDKLGDFMLAWPAFALLKHSIPDAQLCALVPPYTEPMARICPWIDEVIIDPGADAGLGALRSVLRTCRADALITLYSTTRVALAGFGSGIRYRLAPATKFAQLFYNRRLAQRRSRSAKPEWEYNVDLARQLLTDHGVAPDPLPAPPYLHFNADETGVLRQSLYQAHAFPTGAALLIIHPGSGGSAATLSVDQFAALARQLHTDKGVAIAIGCGPGEQQRAHTLAAALDGVPRTILEPADIVDYARHIAAADIFISGSTGPLHVAGALDVPTAAFYTRRRSATPLRWQTLNSPDRRLAFTPPSEADEMDMSRIDIVAAAAEISRHFL